LSVLIDQHSACQGRHPDTICETSAGTPLPVSTVQRMCCDSTIIGITLGEHGEVLNVGRQVHEGNWTLTMTPDRVATWTRPNGTIWHSGPTINRTKKPPRSGEPARPPEHMPPSEYRQPSLC
jgi:hypothetical protein